MEEQINESGQWPANPAGLPPEPKRVPPAPPPIRPRNIIEEEIKTEPENQKTELPIAPPPAPEIGMRTLESDIKSVQGGEPTPVAESVLPSELKEVLEQPETVSQLEQPVETALPGEALPAEKPKKFLKTVLIIIGILIVGGGLGVFGYYVVYPLISPPPAAEEAQSPVSQVAQPPLPIRLSHKSYFIKAIPKSTVNFRDLTLLNISQALRKVAKEADGILKEAEILDMTGGQIYLKDFISNLLILNDADKNNIAENLEQDFTAYLYYDANGVWPGYVLKAKSSEATEKLKKDFLPLVELVDIGNFYLSAPGTFQAFKDGKISGYATRYALASQLGAAFNYGVFGNYIIFSSSYNGLKEAVAALGL